KPSYKDDFYADGGKLFCWFCQTTVNHDQKSVIDKHLISSNYQSKKTFALNVQNPQKTPVQRAIITFHKPYDKKEQFVLDFIKILAEADISFEKI
ncbi:13069_t:CDS:1, partial [Racocetra persica]